MQHYIWALITVLITSTHICDAAILFSKPAGEDTQKAPGLSSRPITQQSLAAITSLSRVFWTTTAKNNPLRELLCTKLLSKGTLSLEDLICALKIIGSNANLSFTAPEPEEDIKKQREQTLKRLERHARDARKVYEDKTEKMKLKQQKKRRHRNKHQPWRFQNQ